MFYVYVLYSVKFDKHYVGMTERLEERLIEHNQGKNKSTKAFCLGLEFIKKFFKLEIQQD